MDQIREYVRTGRASETIQRITELLDQGTEAEIIIKQALIPAMDEVGDLFQKGEYFIPEMLVAARAMQQGIDILKPLIVGSGIEPAGKVVIGTVKGDQHDIGKNLVIIALEGAGFRVIDLGIDVPPLKFVEAVYEHKPQVLGLSALITSTMEYMRYTIEAIKKAGLDVKIMVGGAPVNQEFADEIGADFYGVDSTSGRNYARKVVAK